LIIKPYEHNIVLAQPTEGYVRSPGLHMSDIYNSLYKELDPKRYDKKDKQGNPLPFDLAKLELGTAFEEVLEEALRQRIFGARPGEFTTEEGVIFSPDYIFFEENESILGEFKCTWYSMKNAPHDQKFDKWITQIKAYLHHLSMTRCRLFVFFVNGDYKANRSPVLLAWDLTFTPSELTANWNMLKRHAVRKGMII
jgi:hypothetical protein